MDVELTTQRMKPTCKPYINFLLLMGIISWFLTACGLSSPKETERYGFDIPIDSTKAVWKNYLTDRFWHDTILIDNHLYLPRDQNKHKQLLEKQGISLMDAQTRKVRWHTDFPVEQTVKDGIAYVEMGAQKEMHLELGIRYSYYTIAFNAKTNKPLWRTPFS